ncbi:MAG: citrate lyase holo-[acyl-carrier protein] synthase [Candidatus Accumulibacter sp.]|nr:citrate lyase holo-[acyl-carrier protein] synthase [Accumulibacter sp.]
MCLTQTRLGLLAARDARQEALTQALGAGHPVTLFASLNIAGREKTPPGAEAFFSWMSTRVAAEFPAAATLASSSDALGPYLILGIDGDPIPVKRRCVALETGHPASRLIDLDVYTPAGEPLGRAALGLPARSCLVCERRAVDCIRARRHDYAEVAARTRELLAPFGALSV